MNIRRRILRRDPICVKCKRLGKVAESTEVDHVMPLFKGGSNHDSNLQGLCTECHRIKSIKDAGLTLRSGGGADGMPADPDHPWNKE